MNLGDKIYTLRKQHSLSQEELGEKLNVSRQTISKWERNESTPDLDKIAPLCALFDLSADELLQDKPQIEKQTELETKTVKTKRYFNIRLAAALILCAAILAIPLMQELRLSENMMAIVTVGLIFTGCAMLIISFTKK